MRHALTITTMTLAAFTTLAGAMAPADAPPDTAIEISGVESKCPTDLNGDGATNSRDVNMLLDQWGPCRAGSPCDFNSDRFVDGADLGHLIANWGPCGKK